MKEEMRAEETVLNTAPTTIPQLSERLLLPLEAANTGRFAYVLWTASLPNDFLGLTFGDVLKIDKWASIRCGDFVDAIIFGSPLNTIARAGVCTETTVELWTGAEECWPLDRSKGTFRRIIGRLTIEHSQRIFLSKRYPRVSGLHRGRLAHVLAEGDPTRKVASHEERCRPRTQQRRLLYLIPK